MPSGGATSFDASMLLPDLLSAYLAEREASPRYVESLRRTVRKATRYGIQSVCQLNSQTVNKFLGGLTLSPVTRANIRRELLTLWRFAFEHAYTDEAPVRVLRIRTPRKPPSAWGMETLSAILKAAEADNRRVTGRHPDLFWSELLPAWVAVSYDTGLRFTDVLMLNEGNVRNGCVVLTANKTGKATIRKLSDYGQAKVRHLLSKSTDGTVFRWALTRRRAFVKWREFLNELGVEGSPRFLRRSSATFVERSHPGSAPQFLDHSNPALARLHYIDQTLLDIPSGPPPIR